MVCNLVWFSFGHQVKKICSYLDKYHLLGLCCTQNSEETSRSNFGNTSLACAFHIEMALFLLLGRKLVILLLRKYDSANS